MNVSVKLGEGGFAFRDSLSVSVKSCSINISYFKGENIEIISI